MHAHAETSWTILWTDVVDSIHTPNCAAPVRWLLSALPAGGGRAAGGRRARRAMAPGRKPAGVPDSDYAWPALLAGALLVGIVGGAASASGLRDRRRLQRLQFELPVCAEASLAICSGALLWIGFWDFIDTYLIPTAWWAKLCMLCVGAIGALATRSLYHVDDASNASRIHELEGTSVVAEGGDWDNATLPAELSPRPRALGAADDSRVGGVTRGARRSAGRRRAGQGPAPSSSRTCPGCFLNPPPFSCSRCARALLVTLFGLTMWVGLWDLLESHVMPTVFTACRHEPSTGCAAVKLGFVAVGALGLYLTRSLYGDQGTGPVQFQRL